MIVSNKNSNIGISGSNALAPQEIPFEHSEKKVKKSKSNGLKNKKQKSIKAKAGILRAIFVSFAIGVTLIYRYSCIYNMEKNVTDVKKEISSINAENENLKIGLLKYDNIKCIEEKASKELNMIPKNSNNAQYINLNKNNFKEFSKAEKKEKNNILKKIKEILF